MQLLSGFVGTTGGLAGLVLPLSKCLVIGISWDTLAEFELSKAVPAVMRQMGIC